VVEAAEFLIESLEAHLKYAVPRVAHPDDALQNLHGAMLEQNIDRHPGAPFKPGSALIDQVWTAWLKVMKPTA
jgi:hypothetical protein